MKVSWDDEIPNIFGMIIPNIFGMISNPIYGKIKFMATNHQAENHHFHPDQWLMIISPSPALSKETCEAMLVMFTWPCVDAM